MHWLQHLQTRSPFPCALKAFLPPSLRRHVPAPDLCLASQNAVSSRSHPTIKGLQRLFVLSEFVFRQFIVFLLGAFEEDKKQTKTLTTCKKTNKTENDSPLSCVQQSIQREQVQVLTRSPPDAAHKSMQLVLCSLEMGSVADASLKSGSCPLVPCARGFLLMTSSSLSPASVIRGTARQQSKSRVRTWFTCQGSD